MTGLPTISVGRRYWRMLAPRWSHDPASGEGAARHGGRFNSPGTPALYMSETFDTAVAEYGQDLGIRPGTLCAYDVTADGIMDFAEKDACRAAGLTPEELLTPWKSIALVEHRRPPTWDLADRLIAQGIIGIRVPPTRMRRGRNLVLWRLGGEPGTARVTVLDPLGDLPRDQSSWTSGA